MTLLLVRFERFWFLNKSVHELMIWVLFSYLHVTLHKNTPEYGFSQTRIFPYNGRIEDILAYFKQCKINRKTLNGQGKSEWLFQLQWSWGSFLERCRVCWEGARAYSEPFQTSKIERL